MDPPDGANHGSKIVEVVVGELPGTTRLADFIPIYIPTVEKGALSRSVRKRRFLDFLRARPSKDWFLRSTFVGRLRRRSQIASREEDEEEEDHDDCDDNAGECRLRRRRRFRVPFVRKIRWGKLWSSAARWCKQPANFAMIIWLAFVAAGLLLLFLLMTGMLNDAIPDDGRRKNWTEVINQILNALFTIMCLYQHPTIFHHLVLLLRWRPDGDRDEIRKVYCKEGAPAGPHERAHMLVVVALLHITCLAQYFCCALFWSYSRTDRPTWPLNIGYGVGTTFPVIAVIYLAYSPLGRKQPDTGESSSSGEEAHGHNGGDVEIRIYNRSVVVGSPEWSGGVFDCCDDGTVCALSATCTFCVFGWNMERLGFGNMYVHAFTFILLCIAPKPLFSSKPNGNNHDLDPLRLRSPTSTPLPSSPPAKHLMAAAPTADGGVGTILSTEERDYLVRNSGEQVKISSIEGGIVALYFSASWCPPCRRFTPKLIEAYKELASHGKSFEVIFVSGDQDEEAFNAYFAKMPWLAVPFSDSEGRKGLDERFEVRGIPHLVILDAKTGEVLTGDGVEFVSEYGTEAYPFTPERISELKEQEKAAKDNQTIHSVLGTPDRDYLISNKGDKVPISDLEGKYVGLCFVVSGYGPVEEFTTVLAKIYGKLKEVGEKFEVIAVSLDSDEASFNESFSSMPWLAIPQGDKKCQKLVSYFELSNLPTLVLIGPDGKTLNSNIADIIDEHGVEAWEGFPFNADKLAVLTEKAKAKAASQTLESLLVTGDLDFVIGKDESKVPISELVGKTVLLYFSAKWCGPCRAFLPTLVDVYNKIKEKNSDFEILFVSSDRDQSSFDDFFSGMPWLALPLGDERKAYLSKMFKIRGIPSLVAIGPDGKTVNTDAKAPIAVHGADAFPFTEDRLQELEKKIEEMAKGWPEKLKHELHEHELVLTRRPRPFGCDGCDEMGTSWSYACAECDFDLHTSCALGAEKKGEEEKGQDAGEAAPAGYVCEGDVCRKA